MPPPVQLLLAHIDLWYVQGLQVVVSVNSGKGWLKYVQMVGLMMLWFYVVQWLWG